MTVMFPTGRLISEVLVSLRATQHHLQKWAQLDAVHIRTPSSLRVNVTLMKLDGRILEFYGSDLLCWFGAFASS